MKTIRKRGGGGGEREERRGGRVTFFKGINKLSECSCSWCFQSQRGRRELRGIASDPDDLNVLSVGSFDELVNVTDKLMAATCNSE